MTESLVSLCYLLVAVLLGLGIGGTIWLVSAAVSAVRALHAATATLAQATVDLRSLTVVAGESVKTLVQEVATTSADGMKALTAECQVAHETLGVVTEQVSKLWTRANERVKEPRVWHAREAVNGAEPPEEPAAEREYAQDWRQG